MNSQKLNLELKDFFEKSFKDIQQAKIDSFDYIVSIVFFYFSKTENHDLFLLYKSNKEYLDIIQKYSGTEIEIDALVGKVRVPTIEQEKNARTFVLVFYLREALKYTFREIVHFIEKRKDLNVNLLTLYFYEKGYNDILKYIEIEALTLLKEFEIGR